MIRSARGMESDLAKYRKYLPETGWSEKVQDEWLNTLWNMMSAFVDVGSGREATMDLPFIREKELSIGSTPTRVGGTRLARTRLKILADLRFKLTFEFFIGFELHTIHTSKMERLPRTLVRPINNQDQAPVLGG
jgi:hypothetical protein